MRIPTAKTIENELEWLDKVGDTEDLARKARGILERAKERSGVFGLTARQVDYFMSELDALLQTHGVEDLIDRHGRTTHTYLNAGDTYVNTIVYSHKTNSFSIKCWGDIVERAPAGRYE